MPEDIARCSGEEEWVEGHVTNICPVRYVNEFANIFTAYVWASRGFLPYRGGWAEQPVDLITGLDILFNEADAQQLRRAEQETNAAHTSNSTVEQQ